MIQIYSTSWCPACVSAKKLLDTLGHMYEEINIEDKAMSREDLYKITGGRTVPQIIINGDPIGGFDELVQLNQNGKLNKMIQV